MFHESTHSEMCFHCWLLGYAPMCPATDYVWSEDSFRGVSPLL